MLYEVIVVSFVYPAVAHWVWSPFGWVSALRNPSSASNQSYLLFAGSGAYDFAGDGPVHMVRAWQALWPSCCHRMCPIYEGPYKAGCVHAP
jgi:Amt family ammonium transporter